MEINREKIINIFKKYNIDGFINIAQKQGNYLEYSPLHDELAYNNSDIISTSVTIIKDGKKAVSSLDGFDINTLEQTVVELLGVIPFSEKDADILLPQITDEIEKDFSNQNLSTVDTKFLEKQFNKFKSYKFHKNIHMESFSIGISEIKHFFINSIGAYKSQADNTMSLVVELYGDNSKLKDSSYIYKNSKDKLELNDDMIKKIENEILDKININNTKFKSGDYNISLDKEVVESFLGIIISSLNSEAIREKISMFSGINIGEKIFDEKLSILNSSYIDGGVGNTLFTTEGVTQADTYLFEGGVLKSKFYDYKNAIKEKIDTTKLNTLAANIQIIGEKNKDYLKDSSFLFTNLMAFHTVDMITGKFALSGEGYSLENGIKKEYIKNISLVGNIKDLFKSIISIGDDEDIYSNIRSCSMTFSDQKIIGN